MHGLPQSSTLRFQVQSLEVRNNEAALMHDSFKKYVDSLHPLFERLVQMFPVTVATLPTDVPSQGIYLFSEHGHHLYVGRTQKQSIRARTRQHCIPSARQNEAVFAFKLAREMTGNLRASYKTTGSRGALVVDPEFMKAFLAAKDRVRQMEIRYVGEADPLRQTLLEIYVAVVLKTPYNDFDTH
jgi:hypothetical protein